MTGGQHKGDFRSPDPGKVFGRRAARSLLILNLGIKVLLAGMLIFSLTAHDLPQFAGKAMGARSLTYPLPALLVLLPGPKPRPVATGFYGYKELYAIY
jgi:hypothetical protein